MVMYMWPLATKPYMHSLPFCMHSFICLVHISHTCKFMPQYKALVISIVGEILQLNLPPVLGFTQRKLVRRCEIAGSLDGRYITNATATLDRKFKNSAFTEIMKFFIILPQYLHLCLSCLFAFLLK